MKIVKDNPSELNSYLQKGTPAFILFYWDQCGPCKQTMPHWIEMSNFIQKKHGNKDMIVAKIESKLIPQVKDKMGAAFDVQGYPTILYINANGVKKAFNGANREAKTLIKWVEKNSKRKTRKMMGGRRRKRTRRNKY